MKNSQKQLTELQVVESLRNARDFFEAQPKIVYSSKKNPFTDPDTGFVFNTIDDLLNSLHEIGIQGKTIKEAGLELEEWYELLSQTQETVTGISEYSDPNLTKTTINKNESAQLIDEAEKRARQQTEIREKSKKEVEQGLKTKEEIAKKQENKETGSKEVNNQEKLYEISKKLRETIVEIQEPEIVNELRDKKVYAKIEFEKDSTPKISDEERVTLEKYARSIKDIPKTAAEKLAVEIESRVSDPLLQQGYSTNDVKSISKQVAVTAVENIIAQNNTSLIPPAYQSVVLSKISQSNQIFDQIKLGSKTKEVFSESANNVAVFRIQPDILARSVLKTAFGENFTTFVLGVDPEKIKVTFSVKQSNEFNQEISLDKIHSSQIKILEEQANIFERISGYGKEKINDYLYSSFSNYVQRRIESLPSGSAAKRILTRPEFQTIIFSRYQVTSTPVFYSPGNIVGKLALQITPKYAPILTSLAGGSYAAVAASSYAATYTSIQITGGVFAAEAFAGGAGGALAGASAGSIVPIVGTAIGAVAGYIGGEIVTRSVSKFKVWWSKNKETIAPLLAVGAGLSLARFGMGPAILGGAGTFLMFGGTASALLLGPLRFFAILGRNIGITIATPVIVTLLILPPLVAFVTLVINNSAYVVPPGLKGESGFSGTGTGGGYGYKCTEEKELTGLNPIPASGTDIANRALGIVEDLYQGFWCYWNRSPGDFPNDVTLYPKSYPELFNEDLYRKNPAADPTGGYDLFWCTWLVIKAYNDSGVPIPDYTFSPTMKTYFEQERIFIDAKDVNSSNAKPGAVVFFDVVNEKYRIDHVGIIYSVNGDDITYIQSNAGLKVEHLTLGPNGIQDKPGYIDVIGIGLP